MTSSSDDFSCLTSEKLCAEQKKPETVRLSNIIIKDGIWTDSRGALWVPNEATDFQLRLCVIADAGPAGHRGMDVTEEALRKQLTWRTLASDVRAFIRACIDCVATTGGDRVPRPFGLDMYGTKPNSLVKFDYLALGPSNTEDKHFLILHDDQSNYSWLFPFQNTCA